MRVFANRQDLGYNDRLQNEMFEICKNQTVYIAVAFFNDADFIKKLLSQNCVVKLIVRLNSGTSFTELERIHGKENLEIRYFTRTTFHPKLYIVGSYSVYVGSSNLSKGGLANNTEINLGFKSEENPDVFKELTDLFDYYWIRAKHLSSEELNIFKSIMKDKPGEPPEFSRRITDELGDYGIDNTTLLQSGNDSKEQAEQQKLKEFINDFKRNYGNYVASFNIVREIYTETEERKWPNIPIRIEVDRFLWWLGEVKYKKEEWKIGQFYNKEKQREIINALKPEFLLETKRFKDDSIDNYFILNDKFGSKDQINSLSEDELFDLLYINIYAFGTHAQYEGGKDGLKVALYENNSIADIKKSLIYLLHGSDNYILRLYQCIKGKYSLKVFGEHSVKELYGYVNNEDNPTYNGRIQKSMSWLGFGIL